MGTHVKHLKEVLLMSTHNKYVIENWKKSFQELSSTSPWKTKIWDHPDQSVWLHQGLCSLLIQQYSLW